MILSNDEEPAIGTGLLQGSVVTTDFVKNRLTMKNCLGCEDFSNDKDTKHTKRNQSNFVSLVTLCCHVWLQPKLRYEILFIRWRLLSFGQFFFDRIILTSPVDPNSAEGFEFLPSLLLRHNIICLAFNGGNEKFIVRGILRDYL